MPVQLENLRVNRLILHQIYRNTAATGGGPPPTLSNDFTELDQPGLNTLQDRIISAMGNESHCIEMDIEATEPGSFFSFIPHLIESLDVDFRRTSNDIATKLSQTQTSTKIPGGIVVVFSGVVGIDNLRYTGIIKAEIHEGFSLSNQQGTLSLRFLTQLLLTPQQKLYKIAMIIESDRNVDVADKTPVDYNILVYDSNMTRSETTQAAKYFYSAFLGCSFSPSDKKLTNDFYFQTKVFIDALDIAADSKLDLHDSLYTYLKVSQQEVISIRDYASQFLLPEQRDNYQEHMTAYGLPDRSFHRDLTYLTLKIKRRSLNFNSNVKVSGPSERFNELVNITGSDDGATLLRIQGKVERID